MNRYIIKTLFIVLLAASQTGCKKSLEDQFRNPEVYSKTENLFGGIFLEMLSEHKIFVQDYGEFYYLLNSGCEIPGYSQIAQRHITDRYAWFLNYDDLSGVNGFGGLTNQIWNNRLNDFYTRTRHWAVLNDQLKAISGEP